MINYVLEISLFSMFLAQFIKIFTKYLVSGEWNIEAMFSTGGMPSSHTSLVTTLTITIGLMYHFSSIEFAIAFVFSSVIIHDSMGIRFEAGKHASILNRIQKDIETIIKKEKDNSVVVKELLGHHPIEVVGGLVLGTLVALAGYFIWIV